MEQEKPNIAWHPAFVEAIQLELEDYRENLEFIPEFPLTAEPLKIDCVVIKKKKDVIIKKNIAAIFREINLLEYKSPGDYISVEDFYKVYGYACLYASFRKIHVANMTISFVESRYPKKLLAHLKRIRKFAVEKTSPGIYTVTGDILPIQIIDSRKLSAGENLWLKYLSNELDPLTLIQVSNEAARKDKLTETQRAQSARRRELANKAVLVPMETDLVLCELLKLRELCEKRRQ